MKQKIFTLFVVFMALFAIKNNTNAATITAIATGNWSATTTWDGAVVPSSADSVVIPATYTVTIDNAFATCHGISVQNGGILIQGNSFYVCNISVNNGGVFKSSTASGTNKALFWGALNTNATYTTAATYTAQSGDFKITIDGTGQFGGTVLGTADGIGIFFGELATSLTIDGTSTSTKYIGRLIANNGADQTTSTAFNLNIKQNISVRPSTSSNAMGISLRNNKKFVGSRTMTIYPGYTLTAGSYCQFHTAKAAGSADEGDMIYNIYGTLDLATNNSDFALYLTSFAGSTGKLTLNLGNGTDYAVLKLGRSTNHFNKYYTGQTIKMNWNNPKSKVVFGNSGTMNQIQASGSYSSAYVEDMTVFPDTIRNLSYENAGSGAGAVLLRKTVITDTLFTYGYGYKLYAGLTADATARTVSPGKLFTLNNNAYRVTAVSSPLSTVTSTTLGAAGTWVKGATLTDASGNSYYCDSLGLKIGVLQFLGTSPTGTTLTAGSELTGAPVQVTGNVSSTIPSGQTARFSASAYIGGNLENGAGILYFAKNSTVGGSFTNNGTVTLTGDLETGDLTNNGTITLGTKMLTLNGNISGNNIDASTGYVQYGGTADRTISGFTGNVFAGLRLNTTGTITLGGATTATGLTLTKGKLALGNYDFAPATLSGGSSTAYVVTNGTGKLSLTTTDATAKLFPVGTSTDSYDPVTLTPVTGSATSVSVSNTLSGSAASNYTYNQKEWNITPATVSSTELTLTPSVVIAAGPYPVIGHYTNSAYENINAVKNGNSYTATVTSFSPFVTGTYDLGTGIDKNDVSTMMIRSSANGIILSNLTQGDEVRIYNTSGKLLYNAIANGNSLSVQLQKGLYLISHNGLTGKIAL